MYREAGDRYECSECGATILYEKGCDCCNNASHPELCCDKPMAKISG